MTTLHTVPVTSHLSPVTSYFSLLLQSRGPTHRPIAWLDKVPSTAVRTSVGQLDRAGRNQLSVGSSAAGTVPLGRDGGYGHGELLPCSNRGELLERATDEL